MFYYFAYGSNLNVNEMKKRCPSAVVVGKTSLLGYGLACNRYLTVVENPNDSVEIGIYEIADSDIEALDFYEDYPNLYSKKEISLEYNGNLIKGIIYIMNSSDNRKAPTKSYEKICYEGFNNFGFDTIKLDKAFLDSKTIFDIQNDYFKTGITKEYTYRIEMLKKLKEVISSNEDLLFEAIKKDLNKSNYETYLSELSMVYHEINYFLKNLKKLMKNKKVRSGITTMPSSNKIIHEPYGVSLLISPWNYPIQLALIPLVGSIAAGNTSVMKLSEVSSYTSDVLAKIINSNFSKEYLYAYTGDYKVSEMLLDIPFHKIFFTGSPNIGKLVMNKASKNLTSVTLELGGKSPVIVTNNADLKITARRIIWGKMLNAGQTCVAPDYIFASKSIVDSLIEELKKEIEATKNNIISYPKIISERHFNRLINLIDKKSLIYGGNYSKDNLSIEMTILLNPDLDLDVMKEEIFGPILPIITYDNLDYVLDYINDNEKPLALYIFSDDKKEQNYILKNTSSGGVSINDTILHITAKGLPFGGVNNSGLGSYHEKYSFYCFSHERAILSKSKYFDNNLRYYPQTQKKYKSLRKLLK